MKMAVEINNLPKELLAVILRCLISNELAKSAETLSSQKSILGSPLFTSILRVCRAWYELAVPLLWADVILGNESLFKFTSAITPRNAALIKSLTLHLTPLKQKRFSRPDIEGHDAHWRDLQCLANVLPMMASLATFSLTFGAHGDWPGPACPRGIIYSILSQLPSSVENLQVVTSDFLTLEMGETHHLCAVLGRFLYHAKHVRLCLGMFCPALFDVVLGVEATNSATEQPTYSSSRLETAVFDATNMDEFEVCPSTAELYVMSDPNESYNTAKRVFLERAQKCIAANKLPALRRFAFFDCLNRTGGSFGAIVERDLIKEITRCYPVVETPRPKGQEDLGCLYRCRYQKSNGEVEDIYGEPWRIMDVVTSPVWIQTLQGSTFPPEFRKSTKAHREDYQWRQFSSLYQKAAFYAGISPRNELNLLLRAESTAGRRLLTVRITEGIFDFELLHRERLAEAVEREIEEVEASEVANEEAEAHAYYNSDALSTSTDGDRWYGYDDDNDRMAEIARNS